MRQPQKRGLGTNIARFGSILATGKPPEEDTSALDNLIKYNQIQTGSPEFKMKEAQTRADMEVNKAMDIENYKKKQAQEEFDSYETPKGFIKVGGKIEKDPSYKDPTILTAGQEAAKDKATKEIFENYELNQAKGRQVDNAIEGSDNIPQGFFGKVRMNTAKALPFTKGFLGINDSNIQDAQEMKMALTMGTLAETAHTKGAISDDEMILFKDASANNDFNSPAIVPVLRKIKDFMGAEDSGRMGAYQKNYGEDPRTWFPNSEVGMSTMSSMRTPNMPSSNQLSDEEAYAKYQALKGRR
jgi:hypothetical protein